MFNVGEIVVDTKTGGMGMVIDRWSDNIVDIDLTLPGGGIAIVQRNTADLEKIGAGRRGLRARR